MTDKTTLLPCPFCHGEAIAIEMKSGYGYVQCRKCGIGTDPDNMMAPDDLIRLWNRRYEPTCHTSDMYENIFECSICGTMDTDGKPNYCPNCGARVIAE